MGRKVGRLQGVAWEVIEGKDGSMMVVARRGVRCKAG